MLHTFIDQKHDAQHKPNPDARKFAKKNKKSSCSRSEVEKRVEDVWHKSKRIRERGVKEKRNEERDAKGKKNAKGDAVEERNIIRNERSTFLMIRRLICEVLKPRGSGVPQTSRNLFHHKIYWEKFVNFCAIIYI